MITKTLRNISLALIFIIPFIPLYVSNDLFFLFITGKGFVFRIVVELIFALWLVLILHDKKYAPRFSWLSFTITAFTIAVLVADLLGMNPLRSLWSNFERMEGWVTIVHLWAYFLAVTSIFGVGESWNGDGKRMWHTYFKISLLAAFFVGIYGLWQVFGWAAIHQGSSRIDASLGNSIYMAVYMLVHFFIALYLSAVEYRKNNSHTSWIYIVLALLFSYLLFETATRGTILALIGGGMLSLGIYAVYGREQSMKSRSISIGVIGGIILLGVLFYFNRDAGFIQKNETLRRLASISISDTKTQARGFIWPMAVKGVFETPKTTLIGIGQENFNYIFNANYNPQMWKHEQWFDRVHNVYLDWLVAGGVISLALYLALYVFSLAFVWKSTLSFIEKSILTGLIVGYAIHNIFVFDNLISYILFFTILGFVHAENGGRAIALLERSDDQSEDSIVMRDYVFAPVIIIAIFVVIYMVNVRVIQVNKLLIAGMVSCNSNTPTTKSFVDALNLDQRVANQEIREQLVVCASNIVRGQARSDSKNEFFGVTVKEIQAQIKETPLDARAYVFAGNFYNSVGDWKGGQPILEKALELSPRKQSIVFELAVNYMNSGKTKEALALIEQAYNDAPDNDTSRVGYASILILNGQEPKAREIFGNDDTIFTDQRIINVYMKLKQYSKIIDIYKKLIAKDPENIQNYGSLAATYLQNNDKYNAISILKTLGAKFPATKAQSDELIKQIEAGKNVLQ